MAGAVKRGSGLGTHAARALAVAAFGLAALFAPGSAAASPGDIYVSTSLCSGSLGAQDCSLWNLDPDTRVAKKVADFAPRGVAAVTGPTFEFRGDAVVGFTQLQSGSFVGSVYGFDPETSELEAIVQGGGLMRPNGIALTPRGDLLVADQGLSSNSGALYSVDPNEKTMRLIASVPSPVLDVAVSPGGEIYAVNAGNSVFEVDPNSGAVTSVPTDAATLRAVGVSSDGKLYVGDCGNACGSGIPGSVKQIDRDDGHTVRSYPLQFLNQPTGIAFDTTGGLLASDQGGPLHRLDLDSGGVTQLAQFQLPTGVDVEPPLCAGKTATLVGTTGRDKLRGSNVRDVIVGLGGRDVLTGGGGNDLICGSSGGDTVLGGAGRDSLLGGKHRDKLHGGAGRDRCIGAQGRDADKACEKRKTL